MMEVEKRPRQVLPYAVVSFKYNGPNRLQRGSSQQSQSKAQ